MQKQWHGYNLSDLILLGSGLLATIIVSIIFNAGWIVILNTTLGLIYVFTLAKGKIATQFICIAYFIFYVLLAYNQKLYGEALLYLIIMLPIYIYGAIHWITHKDKQNQVVVKSNLSLKEWIVACACLVGIGIAVFFLLKALNTEQLIVSTLSFISMLPAVYLLARRHKWNQVAFLINDLIVPILWLTLIAHGHLSLVPMCVYHLFQIIYDIYGIIAWVKLEKQQNKNSE